MLQDYFNHYRNNIIGINTTITTPFGIKKMIYADWTASGRAYRPIEDRITNDIMPLLANTHTEATTTGTAMTKAYEESKHIIKQHVHANENDILIFAGSGMTGAVNKLQRILGLRMPERIFDYMAQKANSTIHTLDKYKLKNLSALNECFTIDNSLRPVVFVSQMEHHSNQTSWLETIADVEIIPNDEKGNLSIPNFKLLINKYQDRKFKITAITACSNVTGIQTPYHQVAAITHEHNGWCFVDFACSAPYIHIDMHPNNEAEHLDAIFFSPHKFLGGQGTPGVLIFNKSLYKNTIPDQPGGGTVEYTNPWEYHEYIKDIEHREDGGTPPFLQGIKAALAVKLKEQMGIEKLLQREEEILDIIFKRLPFIDGVEVLERNNTHRLGVISFLIKGAHFNLVVKLLNDKFGIQTRGGCACAGTYGHFLLHVNQKNSYSILDQIHKGDLSCKPGWIRFSIHPIMTDDEINFILDAIEQVATHYKDWSKDYEYLSDRNEFQFKEYTDDALEMVHNWFENSF